MVLSLFMCHLICFATKVGAHGAEIPLHDAHAKRTPGLPTLSEVTETAQVERVGLLLT